MGIRVWNFRESPTTDSWENRTNWQQLTDNTKTISKLDKDCLGSGAVFAQSGSISNPASGTIYLETVSVLNGPVVFLFVNLLGVVSGAVASFSWAANSVIAIKVPMPNYAPFANMITSGLGTPMMAIVTGSGFRSTPQNCIVYTPAIPGPTELSLTLSLSQTSGQGIFISGCYLRI
jgi:hypothetical protein